MTIKPLLVPALLAFLAGSPAFPEPLSTPLATEQACRAPIQSDYPSVRVSIRNHSDFTRQHYPERIAEFARTPLNCGEIVMLGDSLTERFEWQGSINAPVAVRNRGIAGDTSDGMLARLGELTAIQPRAVFILIGTNDLWTSNSPSKVVDNVGQAITTLRASNSTMPIYIQTVFPVRSEPQLNQRVRQINAKLADLAVERNVYIIDTYSHLVDREGLLAAPYTEDGVHLTAAGYARWIELINRALMSAAP